MYACSKSHLASITSSFSSLGLVGMGASWKIEWVWDGVTEMLFLSTDWTIDRYQWSKLCLNLLLYCKSKKLKWLENLLTFFCCWMLKIVSLMFCKHFAPRGSQTTFCCCFQWFPYCLCKPVWLLVANRFFKTLKKPLGTQPFVSNLHFCHKTLFSCVQCASVSLQSNAWHLRCAPENAASGSPASPSSPFF